MATGRQTPICPHHMRLLLIDGTDVQAESTVETAYQVTQKAVQDALAVASETALVVTAAGKVSTPSFTVDSVQESRDGTTYRTVATISSGNTINADGEIRFPLSYRIMAPYIKVLITVTNLDANKYFGTLQVALEVVWPKHHGA